MLSAGRVLIKPEGEYSPLKTYEMLDYVSYNGSSYIAKKTTTGNLPTNTEYWQLSASGAQSQNVASNFAEVEGSDIASSPHAIDDVFVNKDGKLLKATLAISIGDTIVIDTNCKPTTVEGLISYLSTQVSTLDSSNKKLNGITEIAVQTDLHTLDLGEFYKDKTSFYVTNGPEEVDEVASAIFRLTVESALDGSSTTRLLTLKTPGGKVYTQNYDGSSWGDWEQVAFGSEVALKQNIADNTLQTTSKTVPGAINELFLKSETLTNPNLLDNPWFTVNQRGLSNFVNAQYGVDRWKFIADGTPTIEFTNNGIEISDYVSGNIVFYQPLESELINSSKDYTISIMVGDGSIISSELNKTGSLSYMGELAGAHFYHQIVEISGVPKLDIFINQVTTNITIRAVKIELGTVSTLAQDTAPNYQQELAKCQRYFQRTYSIAGAPIGFGISQDNNRFRITKVLPVPMRGTPTVSISLTGSGNAFGIRHSSNNTAIPVETSSVTLGDYRTLNNFITLIGTATGLVANELVIMTAYESGSYIDFSADL